MPLPPRYELYAVGNALVDIVAPADDAFLRAHNLVKGSMTLVDAERSRALYESSGTTAQMASGGSAANTLAGFASLGGVGAFAGKIGADRFGEVFARDLRAQNIHFAGHPLTGLPTGHCLSLVTPDAQRTMLTCLGAATTFTAADVDDDIVQDAGIVYLEGYLFSAPSAKPAFDKAARLAHQAGRKVALTLSDTFCVNGDHDSFAAFVRDSVDILFANDQELLALYHSENLDTAIAAARAQVGVAVTTRGDKDAIIVAGDHTCIAPVQAPTRVVDTTGAGDLYAAGFLYGLARGCALDESARIGAVAAAEIISHYGARPLVNLAALISMP